MVDDLFFWLVSCLGVLLVSGVGNGSIDTGSHDMLVLDHPILDYCPVHTNFRRASTGSDSNGNGAVLGFDIDYSDFLTINLTIGGQDFNGLILNTAESIIYVFEKGRVPECAGANYSNCSTGGLYDPSLSDSYWNVGTDFLLHQMDANEIGGTYVEDTVRVLGGDSLTLQNFTFGLAQNTSYAYPGQVGIGRSDSSMGAQIMSSAYNRVNSSVYSIFRVSGFSDSSTSQGKFLIGGVDTSFFDYLYVFDMNPVIENNATGRYSMPWIFLTLIDIAAAKDTISQSILSDKLYLPVLMDSSSVLSYLPFNTVVDIAVQIGASYCPEIGFWVQDCSYRLINSMVILVFAGGVQIPVPLYTLLLPIYNLNGTAAKFHSGAEVCVLSFRSSSWSGYNSLGMNVLAQMYIAVDEFNSQIGIAPLPKDVTNVTLTAITTTQTVFRGAQDEDPHKTSMESTTSTTSSSTKTVLPSSRGTKWIRYLTDVEGATYVNNTSLIYVTIFPPASNFTDWGARYPLMSFSDSFISVAASLTQAVVDTRTTSSSTSTTTFKGVGGDLITQPNTPATTAANSGAEVNKQTHILVSAILVMLSLIASIL